MFYYKNFFEYERDAYPESNGIQFIGDLVMYAAQEATRVYWGELIHAYTGTSRQIISLCAPGAARRSSHTAQDLGSIAPAQLSCDAAPWHMKRTL